MPNDRFPCLRFAPCIAAVALCAVAAACNGPVAPMPSVASAPAAAPPAPVDAKPAAAAIEPHLADVPPPPAEVASDAPSAACLAKSASPRPAQTAVQRWTDANGIVHYSDAKPPPNARDLRTIALAKPPEVAVQASGYDVNLPDQVQQRAVADALAVEHVMHDALGVAIPAGLKLRIVFVQSAQAYASLIGAPELAGSAGAYSTATKTIHVRMQGDEEGTAFVLRHEIVHAIVHEAIGNLPVALNEGLAEYFGRYRIAGMGGQVDLGRERAALIAAAPTREGAADALVDLLAPEGEGFYVASGDATATREARYRRAFALVALLMGSGEGRTTLSALLAEQAHAPCEAIAAERALDAGYPGGLTALATAWSAFMREPPLEVRAY